LWDLATRQLATSAPMEVGSAVDVTFHPGGAALAVANGTAEQQAIAVPW
jgi:hypothetical protein